MASSFVLFLFNNISNPIIQIFFRSDLRESLQAILCLCGRKRQKNRSLSISSRPEFWSRTTSIGTVRKSSVLWDQNYDNKFKIAGLHTDSSPTRNSEICVNGLENSITMVEQMTDASNSKELPASSQSKENSLINSGLLIEDSEGPIAMSVHSDTTTVDRPCLKRIKSI